MTNIQIASVLYEIAEILELKNPDDRFRIVAYKQAAQKISDIGEDLSDIYREKGRKGLDELPGVGESIAEKIEELIKTGKLKYLEQISKKVPQAELEFSRIPSVGPKTARKLFKETGAKTVGQLEKRLKSKKAISGFKEKTIANILRGIDINRRSGGRAILSDVLPLAEKIVAALQKLPEVTRADYVGSLRRMKETVGDLDLIAASKNSKNTIAEFIKMIPGKVIAQGNTKATVVNEDGFSVDLEILPADEYGSLLQHFTGSKEHNVAFRTYLQKHGLSFSEHGIKKLKRGNWPVATLDIASSQKTMLNATKQNEIIKCATEEDVYHFAGMSWIPPEMREDMGEIKAAIGHKLPNLIRQKNMKGDLQMHTTASDGEASIEQMAQGASKLGYQYIAITDHSQGLGVAHGLDSKRLVTQIKEINFYNKSHKNITVLASMEVDIRADGKLDMDSNTLKKLDIVTGSVHSAFNQSESNMTSRILRAIESGLIDIIGHPTGRLINRRDSINADWPRIFSACAQKNVALEINADPSRLDLWGKMIIEAKKTGCKFSISTDSHSPSQLQNMVYGVAMARRGWLIPGDIINTFSLAGLKQWLKKN